MLSHGPACGKIPRHARASVRLAGESWTRFLEIWEALADPSGDQTIEDFGPFYARVRQLQRLGVPFDPAFIGRVEAISLQCRNRDDDPDEDGADNLVADGDSSDEDEIHGTMACDRTIMLSGQERRKRPDPAPRAGANLEHWVRP